MKFSQILKENRLLKEAFETEAYNILLLSNIIVEQAKPVIEYELRFSGLNAEVTIGNYDNILQDSMAAKRSRCVICFWEFCNIANGLYYKVKNLAPHEVDAIIGNTKSGISLFLENLKHGQLILFNLFSCSAFNTSYIGKNKAERICRELNDFLFSLDQENLILINTNEIIASIGIQQAVDFRYFYSSSALYSVAFYMQYAKALAPAIKCANGMAKKVLILDCDNTLWGGVLGEDGFDGINISADNPEGAVFKEIQHLVLALARQGVIIALCSKNNKPDVQELIDSHPEMVLRDEHLAVKMINWADKSENIKSIAKTLNLGLESMVFVDDSQFEIGLVESSLPEVTTFQVPKNLSQYPALMRSISNLFYNLSTDSFDSARIADYRSSNKRAELKSKFSSLDEYLQSLSIVVNISINEQNHVPRMAQMCQKTNQFNLTTKRHTESDILNLMKNSLIFTAEINDIFGSSGISALAIVPIKENSAFIDTFLMSCRIIGRNIEFSLFDRIIAELRQKGIKTCNASYVKTAKNGQVSNFYDKLGFRCKENGINAKLYSISIEDYDDKAPEYIRSR